MAIINTANTDSIATFVSNTNSLATFVGDIAGLVSGITNNTNPDNLVTAINYIYTLAVAEDTLFANPVTFEQTLTVEGNTSLEGDLEINGSLTFNDSGSASVTIILDEDNMASDSATALATQQSIKAYVDASVASVDAATLDTLNSTQFLRSDANDIVDNDIYIQFGDGTSGSVRFQHVSATNLFQITPYDGASFNASHLFGFDGDEDYWKFAGEMRVLGAFTSLGIDDNGTANRFLITDSLTTIKTAAEVQGTLTLTTGNLVLPQAETTVVTNGAGELIVLDSVNNDVDIQAASTTGLKVTGTAVTLYHTGSAKLSTTADGISVTGDVLLSDDIFGPSAFDITNQAGEEINFTSSTLGFKVGGLDIIGLTATAVSINKNTTITGSLDVSGALNLTSTGTITGPATLVIDNGSTEKLRFTSTGVFLEVGDADIVSLSLTGASITGNLAVSGTITGTLGNITLGNITTGTISAGAISTSATLVITSGDITLPDALNTDVGNNAGELIRFNGSTTNTVELFAGGNEQIQIAATDVSLNYSGSTKLATASGGVTITGAITATGDITAFSSDARLKSITYHPLQDDSLGIINQLSGVAFRWNSNSLLINPASDMERTKIGFIAQEVERVLPEIMGPEVAGFKTLCYEALIPVLVNAINELTDRLELLESFSPGTKYATLTKMKN